MSASWMKALASCSLLTISALTQAEIPADFQKNMQSKFSSLTIETVSETDAGLIEVAFKERDDLIYATKNGKYFVPGDLFRVSDTGYTNLSTETRSRRKQELLNSLNPDEMIVFKAEGEEKEVLTVFTDIECGYCQKLHQEVPKLNKAGVTVQYMAFPRAGVGSGAYTKYVSSYCAEDPLETLTKAKRRETIETALCDNPVKEQYELGKRLGVNATPNMFTSKGELIRGYMPADRLLNKLSI